MRQLSKYIVFAAGSVLAACADAPEANSGSVRRGNAHDGGSDAAAEPSPGRASLDSGSSSSALDAALAETDAAVGDNVPPSAPSPADAAVSDAKSSRDAALSDAATSPDAGVSDAAIAMPDAATSCHNSAIERADGEHACLHAESGPFAMLQLSATAQAAPDASRAHTAFQLSWPADDSAHGFLRVRPARAATHAIFSAGAEVVDLTATSVPDSHCDRLPSATLAELPGGEWTVIRLARMGDGPALVVIEPLTAAGGDACGCDDDAGCDDVPARECRSSGPCQVDSDCCSFCHDGDHCH